MNANMADEANINENRDGPVLINSVNSHPLQDENCLPDTNEPTDGGLLDSDRKSLDGFIINGENGTFKVFKDGVVKISDNLTEIDRGPDDTPKEPYVGPVEEAEEFTVDNQFLLRGYRIRHYTCKSIWKSLFTCHNEFINVWSHIIGVSIFLIILVVLCAEVVPTMNWYIKTLDKEYENLGSAGNAIIFVNGKIADLNSFQQ